MKKTKRFLALMTAGFLAVTPMAATGLTAVASTLTVTDTETADHTYTAYQIITGTKNADGSLTNIAWGTGINSANLINALESNKTALGITFPASAYTSSTDPDTGDTIETFDSTAVSIDDVAEILAGINNADKIEKLAKIFNESGVLTNTSTTLTRGADADSNNYSASSLSDGWYLVVDTSALTGNGKVDARSANLLQVVGDTTINAKHSLPTLDKVIYENSTEKDANTARIGDVVTYKIKTEVPDMRGYDKYFFVIDDTLSPGLTYNAGSLSISIDGGSPLRVDNNSDYTDYATDSADYYVTNTTYSSSEGTSIKVVFENFLANMKAKGVEAGDDITITYTATLNSNAVITGAGNPNTAKLTYSNNPNATSEGKDAQHPDEPKNTDPTGETPEDTVKTYTTAIRIKKVDQNNAPLTGAKFTLTSSDMKYVKVVSLTEFVVDTAGEYYLLNDGTYTKTAPAIDGSTDALYASTSIKYKKQTATSQSTATEEASGIDYAIEAQVDDQGYITFYGLTAGTYILTETLVPDGYNGASAVTITIDNSSAPTSSSPNWSVTNAIADTDSAYYITIQNRQGATLPSTGGIGTKLFYIFGSILVAGSVIFLVTKKRMSAKEN